MSDIDPADVPYPAVKAVKELLLKWSPDAPWCDEDVEKILAIAWPHLPINPDFALSLEAEET